MVQKTAQVSALRCRDMVQYGKLTIVLSGKRE